MTDPNGNQPDDTTPSEPSLSEAEALLTEGRSFPNRLGIRRPNAPFLLVGWKADGVSIYEGDAPITHFDLNGRWVRAYRDDRHYLRALDGRVIAVDRPREDGQMVLDRRVLERPEADTLDERIRAWVAAIARDVEQRAVQLEPTPDTSVEVDRLTKTLKTIVEQTAEAWRSQEQLWTSTYRRFGFLPPETHRTIRVQACPGEVDGIGFGGSEAEVGDISVICDLNAHLQAIAELERRRLDNPRPISYGEGGALLQGPEVVGEQLRRIRDWIARDDNETAARPVVGFVHQLGALPIALAVWRSWAEAGLTRVDLGIESGSESIRALFGKDWTNAHLGALVHGIKSAGIAVRLIILSDPGHRGLVDEHRRTTLQLCEEMDLSRDDLLFLVDIRDVASARWWDEMANRGLVRLSEPEPVRKVVHGDLKHGLGKSGPRVVRYDMAKEWF